eukprot:g863.t1
MHSDWKLQSQRDGFRLERLNGLAFPKGKAPLCETTNVPATFQMITPYLTLYFATREDAIVSWESIMHKLCPLLGPLRSQPPIVGSEEERIRRNKTLQVSLCALVDLAHGQASTYLRSKRYKLAAPAALQALKLSREAFGAGSGHSHVITSLLLLGEAHIGIGNMHEAEQALNEANVKVLKSEELSSSFSTKSRLHRNFGKIFLKRGDLKRALRHSAFGVYYLSADVGPENIMVSQGYFDCAKIFFAMRKIEQGLAFLDKVVDTWYHFLASLSTDKMRREYETTGTEADQPGTENLKAAKEMLVETFRTRTRILGSSHIATGEAAYTVGLLHLLLGTADSAETYISNALAIYSSQLGDDHPSTEDVRRVLKQIERS